MGPAQLVERLAELRHRRASETIDLEIAHAVGGHIGRIDRVERNLVADDHEMQRCRLPVAHDVDFDPRAGLAAQVLRHVGLLEAHGVERVDAHDAVVGHDAHALGRPADDRIDHDHRIPQHIELDADAAELTVETLLHALHILRTDIGRMGVQLFEHPLNGAFDQRPHLHLVDIQPVEVAVNLHQFPQLLCGPGLLRREGQGEKGGEEK